MSRWDVKKITIPKNLLMELIRLYFRNFNVPYCSSISGHQDKNPGNKNQARVLS